ncbi:MAG: GNAT family N-acetyltransferase [archaeon GB-1867-035]|nr:GNAT family N-acetyltransferase [Candidatus Culexmicrobium profundum]
MVKAFWSEDVQLTFGRKFLVKKLPAFVAVTDGNIIGFISYYDLNEEELLIVAIGVLPEYQRKGIGRTLLLTVEEKARKTSCFYLQ